MAELLFQALFWGVVIFTGCILVTAVVTGKAFDVIRWRRPEFVERSEQPREYRAGVFLAFVWFAIAIWMFVGTLSS
jgi:hypothetical protein